jgi:hypothetical protein
MTYYKATNTGKGFITHSENEENHIAGYPSDIWITENISWAERVGAIPLTKEEAQSMVDESISGLVYPERHLKFGQPIVITLP